MSMMDYQGQLLCERLYQIIIGGAGVRHTPAQHTQRGHGTGSCSDLTCLACPLLLLLTQLIGFGVGYHAQSFWLTFLWCVGGLAVALLVCVPDWPWFNRHPLAWQAATALPGSTDEHGQLVKDSNDKCGTCVCGMSIHGVGCDSHPDYAATAAAAEAAGAAGEQPAASSASSSSLSPPVVEIQAIKVKSTKKGK